MDATDKVAECDCVLYECDTEDDSGCSCVCGHAIEEHDGDGCHGVVMATLIGRLP